MNGTIVRLLGAACVFMGCSDGAQSVLQDTSLEQDGVAADAVVPLDAPGADDSVPRPDVEGTDASGFDVAAGPDDAAGGPAGTSCTEDDMCRSGWCVPSIVGQICVDLCVTSCEAGQACVPADDAGTDPVSLCVPIVAPPQPVIVGADVEVIDGSETLIPQDDASTSDGVAVSDTSTIEVEVIADAAVDANPDDAVVVDAGPDVPTEETIGGDQDGDGIPDDEDLLPCLAVYLVVYNDNVASASIDLNGREVVSANAFPTADPITVTINPSPGTNTLALGGQLTGSPADTLTLMVVDSAGVVYFATVIAREPGKPSSRNYTFDIDATCP